MRSDRLQVLFGGRLLVSVSVLQIRRAVLLASVLILLSWLPAAQRKLGQLSRCATACRLPHASSPPAHLLRAIEHPSALMSQAASASPGVRAALVEAAPAFNQTAVQ